MCQEFDEICSDFEEKGRVEGEAKERENGIRKVVEACRNMGATDDSLITTLGTTYSLTPKKAKTYL